MKYLKALYFTIELVRCDNCHKLKPAFNCPVLNWLDTTLCRRCSNKILYPDYYKEFNPFRDFIAHFRESLNWLEGDIL